ncbi:unnamed protein product [Parascedosporium putredinis]|uniref:Stress-response A/B barrel domain-containing protein n=1 Tax=Parascedosporium putredinis TaxID=1442378 RepID=A0A9P1MB43_9PEZI|nr:unnamed protein product [Parascedosporium putredinis]CAI7993930.1 unnamed protein product [Parascedosporium putredinis]
MATYSNHRYQTSFARSLLYPWLHLQRFYGTPSLVTLQRTLKTAELLSTSTMSASPMHRVTLFKIESQADRQSLMDLYRTLPTTAVRNGKPYILSAAVGPTFDDTRNQGYTLAAFTMFATEDDMRFYDEGCAAHAEIKKLARSIHGGGVMTVYFQDGL